VWKFPSKLLHGQEAQSHIERAVVREVVPEEVVAVGYTGEGDGERIGVEAKIMQLSPV
jgi:hypothetical protein